MNATPSHVFGKAAGLRLAAAIAFLAAVFGGAFAHASTIALYTFEGGTVGEAVTTIPNAANPGTYTATAYRLGTDNLGWGEAPYWTNNVPGNCIWSDASCTQMLARAPMAVHFATNGVDEALGGCLDMASLASTLYSLPDGFTVEFFWHPSSSTKGGMVASMAYGRFLAMRSGTSYSSCVRMDSSTKSTNDKSITYLGQGNRWLPSYGWRHWAMTFDKATDKATLWFDYDNYGSIETPVWYAGSDRPKYLRFGARAQHTDKTFYKGQNCSQGEITCIRVSDRVLGADEFMRMGAAAYYPLKDAAAGTTATTVTNSLVAGDADGTAGHIGDSGKTPVFSDDRPGRYIYSSAAKDNLLCEEPGSLQFRNGTSAARGYVSLAGLAGRLLMVTREKQGMTFECFFKDEPMTWGNLNLLSFQVPHATGKFWHAKVSSTTVTSSEQDFTDYDTVAETEGESLANDGQWHHLAVVFSPCPSDSANDAKQWKAVTVYLDYAQPANASRGYGVFWQQGNLWDSWLDTPFIVDYRSDMPSNANGFLGKVSSVRVTSGVLTPDQFMVASDTTAVQAPGYGFRWRFEEGTAGSAVSTVADAAGLERWTTGGLTTYGATPAAPTYSKARPASLVKVDGVETNNVLSAAMAASGDRTVLENKTWYGVPALHPESWTMELFVKADASRASDALIVGRGRLNPSTGDEWSDWALALQPDGRRALSGFRDDGEGGKAAYAFANLGTSLNDGRWHRLEVVYNGGATSFQVWADDAKVLETTLASAQIDTPNARYQFGAGCNLASFGGDIDEVRFVGRALAHAEFATLRNYASVITLR